VRLCVALAFILAACSTQAERELARMNRVTDGALADMNACSARTEASAPYLQLRSKLPPTDGTPPPPALIADQSKPTPSEVALLVELHTHHTTPCRRLVVERLSTISPAFATVAAQTFADADAEYARLVRGRESWGAYAEASQRRRLAFLQAFSAAGDQVNHDLAESHVLELQQRQAVAMARWEREQQAIAGVGALAR
jgi:hypothetical protein